MKTLRARKILSVMLTIALVLELIPSQALAEVIDQEGTSEEAVAETVLEVQEESPDEIQGEGPDVAQPEESSDESLLEESSDDAVDDAVAEPTPLGASNDDANESLQVTGRYPYISDPMPIEPDSDIMVYYGFDTRGDGVLLNGLYIEGEHEDGTLTIELPNILDVPVTINGVTSKTPTPVMFLGDDLFNWVDDEGNKTCTGLPIAHVVVPPNVEDVAFWTFRPTQWSADYQHVPNLKSVTFAPNSHCKELGYNFDGTDIESLVLPDHLETIGTQLCQGCKNLTSIEIPATVKTIDRSAFRDTQISSISLPEGLTSIGNLAFAGLPLTSVSFPNSLKTIGNQAFTDCASLTSVKFGTSMTASQLETIGNAAFNFCPITKVQIPNSVTRIEDTAFGWDQHADPGPLTSVTIGTSQAASKLEFIGVRAFLNQSITSIRLPNSMKDMNAWSPYQGCTKLETIVWPTSATDTFNTVQGLDNLPSLKDEVVNDLPPYITTIGREAYRKSPLEHITIPSTVQTVGEYSFFDSWVQTLAISDGVQTIEHQAFYNNKIESIHIPGSVTSIGEKAFDTQYGEATISSFTIEEEGEPLSIGNWMCRFAPGTTVVLPERVTYLGKQALVSDGVADKYAVTYYIYNKDIDFWCFDDGKELTSYVSSDVPFQSRSIIYYPQDTDPTSDLGRLVEYAKTGEYADRISYLTFIPFDENAPKPTYGIMGTVPTGATVRLLLAGEETTPELVDNGTTASFSVNGIEEGTPACAIVSLEGYKDLTLFPSELASGDSTGAAITDTWQFAVTVNDMTPLSDLGTLRVTTNPDAEGHYDNEINVAVFKSGKLVSQGTMLRAGFYEVADLSAGDYDVIAWKANDAVTRVSGVDDLSRLGFRDGTDYLRRRVSVRASQVVELNLGSVPDFDVSRMTGVVEEGEVTLSATKTTPGTTLYLRVRYTMAEGRTANEVRVNIPAGLMPTSAATTAKRYGTGGWNAGSHVLTLNNLSEQDKAGALVTIGLRVETAGSYDVSASVTSDGVACALGSVRLDVPAIELIVPTDRLSTTSFALDVYATAGSDVTLTIGGTQLTDKTYQTNKLGHLRTTVTIPEGELGIGQYYLVTATVGEDSATGLVSYQGSVSAASSFAPRIIDFFFEHGGRTVYLAKDGEDLLGGYYTVIDKPDMHSNAYRAEWPFEAVIESKLPLRDTAMLRLGMADGSIRTCEMSRAKTEPLDNDVTRYTYRCSVKIGTGKLEYRLKPKDIPCRFDVLPQFEQDVDASLNAIDGTVLEGLDTAAAYSLTYQNKLIDTARKEKVKLGDKTYDKSYEDIDQAWLEWVLSLDEPRRTETLSSLGIFGYAYKHEVFDPDGTIWASMSEEERAAYIDTENQIDELYGYLAVMMGDKKPLPAYASMEEYLADNYGLETGQSNNRAALERQGYTIVDTSSPEWQVAWQQYGSGYGDADVPAWVAIKYEDGGALSEGDRLGVFDEFGGHQVVCKTPKNTIKIRGRHQSAATSGAVSGAAGIIASAGDVGYGEATSVAGTAAGRAFGTAATVLNVYNTYNSISSYGDAISEFEERKGELTRINQQIAYYENRGQGNSACVQALRRERNLMEPLVETLDSSAGVAMWDIGFNTVVGCGGMILGAALSGTGIGTPVGLLILGASAAYTAGSVSASMQNAARADVLESYVTRQRAERTAQCKDDEFGRLHYYKKFNLDPSGFVFEGVENNRVEGVVATIYHQVNEGTWEVWSQLEAEEYEQTNTQTTDANGLFAWDVPMGLWKVLFSKEGYEDTWSNEMEVPPEWTDVPINLLRSDAPKVEGDQNVVADDGSYVDIVFNQHMQTEGPLEVLVDGKPVEAEWQEVEAGFKDDGTEATLSKVLRVPLSSVSQGATATVTVSAATSYTGKAMLNPYTLKVKVPSTAPKTVAVYRLYNHKTSEHLWTTSENEYKQLPIITKGDWRQEDVAWLAPDGVGTPVYRLYNRAMGDHYYSMSQGEINALTTKYGWTVDNGGAPAFWSAAKGDGGAIPLYCVYNSRLKKGQHHFTRSVAERDFLTTKAGWRYEKEAFYGYLPQ